VRLAALLTVTLATALALATSGAPAADATRTCRAGTVQKMGTPTRAYAAVVRRSARAYKTPGGAVVHRFDRITVNGGPTVFGVVGRIVTARCKPTWYRVQLPVRPNGTTAWVHAFGVKLARVSMRIEVDLRRRRLTLFARGRPLLSARIAVGTSATPTPRGRYYVKEELLTTYRGGPYGPGALGLSAYSPVLKGWAQGGPIGIHGTNEPSSIGRARSNGCIRVFNPVATRLLHVVPLGTPVVVR
jgi:lipoprotein-anchoring transpeptidase ErfK/SrfK